MKTLATIVLAAFVYSGAAFAHGTHSTTEADTTVKTSVTKKSKKKKVAMCADCGKPETECNCHEEKK